MKRRLVAVAVAMLMVFGLLSGCGASKPEQTADDVASTAAETTVAESSVQAAAEEPVAETNFEGKAYNVAIPFPDSGMTSFEILRTNLNLLGSETQGTFINCMVELTPDAQLSFVEAQIAAGVDGLILCPSSDSILPTVTTLCEDAGVYWGITMRSISDPEIKELVEASPFYVGNCYEDEITAGYTCGKWMGEQGYKKVAIISQAKGDTTCDAREEGLAKACDEFGIEIVGESRAHAQASDTAAATESFLAANPDLDAIFIVGSPVTGSPEACVNKIIEQNSDVKVVTIDFPDSMVEEFASGTLVYSYAQVCLTYDPYITTLKVVNAIQGTPLADTCTSNSMAMSALTSEEEAVAYQNITGNPNYLFYDANELQQFFKWINTDLNEASLQEMVDSYVID